MMNYVLSLLGLSGVALFIYRLLSEKDSRNTEADLFRRQQEQIIADRDKSINGLAQIAKESTDAYFKKQAEWRANRKSNGTKPPTGNS